MGKDGEIRSFLQVDLSTCEVVHAFKARTARCAALKSASRGEREVAIVDSEMRKLHVYSADMRPIQEHERTDYSRRHGIEAKPVVAKVAYQRIPTGVSLTEEGWDAEKVRAVVTVTRS